MALKEMGPTGNKAISAVVESGAHAAPAKSAVNLSGIDAIKDAAKSHASERAFVAKTAFVEAYGMAMQDNMQQVAIVMNSIDQHCFGALVDAARDAYFPSQLEAAPQKSALPEAK